MYVIHMIYQMYNNNIFKVATTVSKIIMSHSARTPLLYHEHSSDKMAHDRTSSLDAAATRAHLSFLTKYYLKYKSHTHIEKIVDLVHCSLGPV
jgi:hypothetical protein